MAFSSSQVTRHGYRRAIPLIHDPQTARHDPHDHECEIRVRSDHGSECVGIDLPQLCVAYGQNGCTARCSVIDQRHLPDTPARRYGFIDDAAAHDPEAAFFYDIERLSLIAF